MQTVSLVFPTTFHRDAANAVTDFFTNSGADAVLVVNSCARGQAVPESDLDFAVLVKEKTSTKSIAALHKNWLRYADENTTLAEYNRSSPYAHLHLDIINGIYKPGIIQNNEPMDFFELIIGNQICYSIPVYTNGDHFTNLRDRWLPYYDEVLRLQRLRSTIDACRYDLGRIPLMTKRGLYFHAFDLLYKAFQEYLQALFIANKTYPLAYNKWIRYQVAELLKKPELYPPLPDILSVTDIESNEMNGKAITLGNLLANVATH